MGALRQRNDERVAEAILELKRKGLYVLTKGSPIVRRQK